MMDPHSARIIKIVHQITYIGLLYCNVKNETNLESAFILQIVQNIFVTKVIITLLLMVRLPLDLYLANLIISHQHLRPSRFSLV